VELIALYEPLTVPELIRVNEDTVSEALEVVNLMITLPPLMAMLLIVTVGGASDTT
jgi:hypothetical protein